MMYRAFVPIKVTKESRVADELEAFPSWLVSFDGQRFVEVVQKPEPANASTMRAAWSVAVDGPRKGKRGQSKGRTMPSAPPIPRYLVERFAEKIEQIPETQQETGSLISHMLEGDLY